MTDFGERPSIVDLETMQACNLACVHCRACAQPLRQPQELSTDEAQPLIDQMAAHRASVFVIRGGDPFKRPDLYDLVGCATAEGVRTSPKPSATPLLTREAITWLQWLGLARPAISLDGSNARIHDAFRRVPGSYDWTLQTIRSARQLGVPV